MTEFFYGLAEAVTAVVIARAVTEYAPERLETVLLTLVVIATFEVRRAVLLLKGSRDDR